MKQKTYVLKIILSIFIINIFFVFGVAPPRLALVEAGESFARTNLIGSIDMSVENQAKVCKDSTCANPKPGIIYFKVSSDSPLIVDTEKGLSGKVWGDELGWVSFNPPYGGVFFADPATGLLKGTAWSETSGAINFSVTGQKVIIHPKTGEWNGWAWASGPYGGWVKFDCKDNSCVRTIWSEKKQTEALLPSATEARPLFTWTSDVQVITSSVLNNFSDSFINLFDGTEQLISGTFNSLFSSLTNTGTAILREIAKINGSAFTTSAFNLKNLFNQMVVIKYEMADVIGQQFNNIYNSVAVFLANIFTQNSLVNKNEPPPPPTSSLGEKFKAVAQEKSKIMSDNFDIFVTRSTSLFNGITALKSNVFDKAGDGYYAFSSNLINLRGSVLEGISNLFK